MIKKRECVLVFVEESQNEIKSPIKIEHHHSVICDDMGTWSSNYYVDRNRDMMKSVNLRVQEFHLYSNDGQLRFVDFNGTRYEIKNVLNDRDKGIRFKILDCQELKR